MKVFSTSRSLISLFSFLLISFLFSCQKETSNSNSSVTKEQAATYSDETAQADASFDDVADIGMVAADADNNAATGRTTRNYFPDFGDLRLAIGNCATITVFPNASTYPKTITIDFGDSCVGFDGTLRKGKIVLYLSWPILPSGSVFTITFVDFNLKLVHL